MRGPTRFEARELALLLFVIASLATVLSAIGIIGGDKAHERVGYRDPVELVATDLTVEDGDTIRWHGHQTIRLLQINAPELDECMGREAKAFLQQRIAAHPSTLRLIFDPRLEANRYGRTWAYLSVRYRDVGVEMVRRGLARAYFINGERGRFADDIELAQQRAKRAGRGIWSKACRS